MSLKIVMEFLGEAADDPRVTTAHISLYLVLFRQWYDQQEHPYPFPVHLSWQRPKSAHARLTTNA
jgi:hypothetical protein